MNENTLKLIAEQLCMISTSVRAIAHAMEAASPPEQLDQNSALINSLSSLSPTVGSGPAQRLPEQLELDLPEPPTTGYTVDDIRALAMEAIRLGQKDALKSIFADHDATSVTSLDPAHYQAVAAKIESVLQS